MHRCRRAQQHGRLVLLAGWPGPHRDACTPLPLLRAAQVSTVRNAPQFEPIRAALLFTTLSVRNRLQLLKEHGVPATVFNQFGIVPAYSFVGRAQMFKSFLDRAY
jgi:hypothetical protein